MILGASHLAIRCPNAVAEAEKLASRGWTIEFVDSVHLHPIQWEFMSGNVMDPQTVVFIRHPVDGIALELVSPAAPAASESASSINMSEIELGGCVGSLFVPGLADAEAFFLGGLGFSNCGLAFDAGGASKTTRIQMKRPLSRWSVTLDLVGEKPERLAPRLDAKGWYVLALLSTNVKDDLARLQGHPAIIASTPVFQICVNQKKPLLALCFLQNGFGIELFQV